jgi:hypothetical protein
MEQVFTQEGNGNGDYEPACTPGNQALVQPSVCLRKIVGTDKVRY